MCIMLLPFGSNDLESKVGALATVRYYLFLANKTKSRSTLAFGLMHQSKASIRDLATHLQGKLHMIAAGIFFRFE